MNPEPLKIDNYIESFKGLSYNSCTYTMHFFSKELPYLPMFSILRKGHIHPLVYVGGISRSNPKDIVSRMKDWCMDYLIRTLIEDKAYLYGPGALYIEKDENTHEFSPLILWTVQGCRWTSTAWRNKKKFVHQRKPYMQVFIANNIRSVNSSLWAYLRDSYIPLLELEELNFRFMSPEAISRLTMRKYQKPTISSMDDLEKLKEKEKQMASLSNVFNELNVVDYL